MKNADMPAMPVDWEHWIDSFKPQLGTELYHGLTKREIFAMHAMQGLCAHSGDYHRFEHLASDAVNYADALLEALENTK